MEDDAFNQVSSHLDYDDRMAKIANISIAISLKRIADMMQGDEQNCGVTYYLSGLEMNTRKNG